MQTIPSLCGHISLLYLCCLYLCFVLNIFLFIMSTNVLYFPLGHLNFPPGINKVAYYSILDVNLPHHPLWLRRFCARLHEFVFKLVVIHLVCVYCCVLFPRQPGPHQGEGCAHDARAPDAEPHHQLHQGGPSSSEPCATVYCLLWTPWTVFYTAWLTVNSDPCR